MKAIVSVIAVLGVFLTTGTLTQAQNIELRGSGVYYVPNGSATTGGGQTEFEAVEWDSGTGFEVQGIFWTANSPWGFGASIGKATWDIDGYELIYMSGNSAYGDTLEGDADLTAFGLSVFYKLFSDYGANQKLHGALEGGLKFVSVDSNIKGETGIAGAGGVLVWDQTLEIDDSILGHLAFELSYAFTEQVSLFGQGGFQFDLDKGGVENPVSGLGTFEAGETELTALYGKAGLSVSF